MKKSLLAFGFSVLFLLVGVSGVSAEKNRDEKDNRRFSLPIAAVEMGPGVFSLGNKVDSKTGERVEGYAFVHYKQGFARGGSAKPPKGNVACYGFLATDAKWKVIEPWLMNTTNTQGLDGTSLFNLENNGITKWETAANANILGNGTTTANVLSADAVAPDNQNEVYFGEIADPGAIAVTTVWGVFGGPSFQRRLSEWDMVFDQVDFGWATNGDVTKMDFDNIATHELGHAVGMADLYNSACNLETMYGYATEGQTLKQTLNAGDIAGINLLY